MGVNNEIRCLQGGVKVPTGGTVRERFGLGQRQLTRCNSGTDSDSLDGRRRADAPSCVVPLRKAENGFAALGRPQLAS